MLIAAAAAVWIRVNILITVPMVWVSNPVTMGPMYFLCYLVGAEILGEQPVGFDFELSFDWLLTELAAIWQPFLLGCLVLGLISALAAFILVRVLWHLHILSHIRDRAERRHNRKRNKPQQP